MPFTINIKEPQTLNVSYGKSEIIEAASVYNAGEHTFSSEKDSVTVSNDGSITVQGFTDSKIYMTGKNGEKYIGVVYNPYLDEMFTAERGKGAFLNGRPIHVSRNPLSEGIVLFGTAPYYEELSKKSFQMAYAYFKKALDVRRSGSAAIDLCSIAAGRAELYFELRLSPWDFAAGALIVEEAGGVVTTVEGGAVTLGQKCSVLATNGRCGRLE